MGSPVSDFLHIRPLFLKDKMKSLEQADNRDVKTPRKKAAVGIKSRQNMENSFHMRDISEKQYKANLLYETIPAYLGQYNNGKHKV